MKDHASMDFYGKPANSATGEKAEAMQHNGHHMGVEE
jgi:hypothetical protein